MAVGNRNHYSFAPVFFQPCYGIIDKPLSATRLPVLFLNKQGIYLAFIFAERRNAISQRLVESVLIKAFDKKIFLFQLRKFCTAFFKSLYGKMIFEIP